MAQQVDVVADELREAAGRHREITERLSVEPSTHAAVTTALESLGPVFGDVRDAGRLLLDQRQECYQRQAAAHADLADKLGHAADAWEINDAAAAGRLGTATL